MKKIFNLLLCVAIVFTFVNCTLRNNKTMQNSTKTETVKSEIKQNEDFNKFIARFHFDSIFQMSRLADVVEGFNSDDYLDKYAEMMGRYDPVNNPDEQLVIDPYIWKGAELLDVLDCVNDAYHSDRFAKEYEFPCDSVANEKLYIESSSVIYECSYKLRNGVWINSNIRIYCF